MMALVRAKVCFTGVFSMSQGDIMEYSNESVLQDLLDAGYIEHVLPVNENKAIAENEKAKKKTTKKVVKNNEDK